MKGLQDVVSQAKALVQRLREKESAVDTTLKDVKSLNEHLTVMRQFREESVVSVAVGKPIQPLPQQRAVVNHETESRPSELPVTSETGENAEAIMMMMGKNRRSPLSAHQPVILALLSENRRLAALETENAELVKCLEEYQSAVDMIMHKYRGHIEKFASTNQILTSTIADMGQRSQSERTETELRLLGKINDMAAVMKQASEMDDNYYVDVVGLVTRLHNENRTLRELLDSRVISGTGQKANVSVNKPDSSSSSSTFSSVMTSTKYNNVYTEKSFPVVVPQEASENSPFATASPTTLSSSTKTTVQQLQCNSLPRPTYSKVRWSGSTSSRSAYVGSASSSSSFIPTASSSGMTHFKLPIRCPTSVASPVHDNMNINNNSEEKVSSTNDETNGDGNDNLIAPLLSSSLSSSLSSLSSTDTIVANSDSITPTKSNNNNNNEVLLHNSEESNLLATMPLISSAAAAAATSGDDEESAITANNDTLSALDLDTTVTVQETPSSVSSPCQQQRHEVNCLTCNNHGDKPTESSCAIGVNFSDRIEASKEVEPPS